jgi:hypothetical protein
MTMKTGRSKLTSIVIATALASSASVALADQTIWGTTGDDTIYFGLVNDAGTLKLGVVTVTAAATTVTNYPMDAGRLTIGGGVGNDHIEAVNDTEKNGLTFLNAVNLTFTEIYLLGGDGNDVIRGTPKADCLYGHGGNDFLVGNQGNDVLFGGDGDDFLSGGRNEDRLYGDNGNDYLVGDQEDDRLFGLSGDDILVGGTGDDYRDGGDGNDEVWCRTVPADNPNASWDDTADQPASSDCGDSLPPVNVETQKQGNPYEDWVTMANYGHGLTTFHRTTSNPDLLLADRAAGAVLLLSSGGDVPVFGDFDRDGHNDDLALFRPTLGKWAFDYNHDCDTDALSTWAEAGDLPVAGDFDRDGQLDDVAVFRPGNRMWYFDYNHNGTTDKTSGPWGAPGDIPIAGSFDADGKCDDVGVFRPGTRMWYYDYDANGTTDESRGPWGLAGDIPVVGDFLNTRQNDDVAVFRPSTGMWYYDYNHNGTTDFESPNYWGATGDIPFAGDFDGDGRHDDVGLFRISNRMWYFDYDRTAGTDKVRGPWGEPGMPLHATHKQYGSSCGPTSLEMVFKHLGMTQPGLRRWFWRDLDDASNTPVPSTCWPSNAVDVGYHLSMEHIMYEGFRHQRKTDPSWAPSANLISLDGRLNTADGSCTGAYLEVRYDVGNVDWNSATETATGRVQMWLQHCAAVGWGERNPDLGLPYVANKFSDGRNDALPIRFSFGPTANFKSLAHLQAVIEGYINHGIPLVAAVENGGHFNTIIGYRRVGSTFYVYTADPLDGYGRPFYGKPMRWRRIILNEEMVCEGSGTLVALMLYGHASAAGGGSSWAQAIDDQFDSDLLCGYLQPLPPRPPSPVLTSRFNPPNAMTVRLEGTPNTRYVLEGTPHLNAPVPWTPIVARRTDAHGVFEFVETNVQRSPMKFYRAVLDEP